jgi:hypothetical protein
MEVCVVFFSFLFLWLTGKHPSEASEREIPPFLWLAEVLVGSQFFHPLKPDLRCSTAPQATRAPFPCSSSSSSPDAAFYGRGAQRWSARGFHAPGCSSHFGRAYGHVSCHSRAGWFPRGFLALGGCWVGPEAAHVLHAPSSVGVSSVGSSCFGCFFASTECI